MKDTFLLPGDFVFFYPQNFIDRTVAYWTGRYNHCSIHLAEGLMLSARVLKGIDFDLVEEFNPHYDIYRIEGITEKEVKEMINFAISLRGRKYDLRQAISIPFNRILPFRSSHYFCSEFLAVCCIRAGYIPSVLPEIISPTQLANQEFLKQIRRKRER